MHAAAAGHGYERVLEISTKSDDYIGRALSAFNLSVKLSGTGEMATVEGLFQGSKVFESGGPYRDLYRAPGREAKRDPRIRNSGRLIGFDLNGTEWPLEPKTAFYDWLYVASLIRNPELGLSLLEFDGFTDVEFNPARSINCQAHSAALFVALHRDGRLPETPPTKDTFLALAYGADSSLSTDTERMTPEHGVPPHQPGLFGEGEASGPSSMDSNPAPDVPQNDPSSPPSAVAEDATAASTKLKRAPGSASVSSVVKSIQNVMWKDAGVDGDAQRLSQLGWMLFLKLFDDREQEYELEPGYRSPIPAPVRWRAWATDEEGITGDALLDFVDSVVFPTLKGEPTDHDGQTLRLDADSERGLLVRGVFEDAYNYMKSGTLLRQVVNKLNEIDFTASTDRHVFNDVYEMILKDLQSAGNAGEYYTPRAVTRFMTERVDPALGETVLDPACGTGGFLVDTIEHLRRKGINSVAERDQLQQTIRGIEKKPLPHLLCTTNLVLHDIEVPDVRHDNSLARPLASYGPADRIDVALSNPPFGGIEEDGIENNFPLEFRTRETADLFIALILRRLKSGGRAAVVLPDGFLFGEGVKTRLKERLMAECDLHTIVRLPNGVFAPYTSINTNLLFFEKGRPTKTVWFVEHPLPEGYKNYTKTKPIRFEEFGYLADWWDDREETEWAWPVSASAIADGGYNLDLDNPHQLDAVVHDPAELLAELKAAQAAVQETRDVLRAALAEALA